MNNLLVLQSDFGLVDGAVSAMIELALRRSPTLKIHHLTHDITLTTSLGAIVSFRQLITGQQERLCVSSGSGVGSKRKSVVAKG